MLWNLKKVFLTEDEVLNAEYDLDLHDLKFNGTTPFKTPVRVSAKAENRAGVVDLAVTAAFDYTARFPADRSIYCSVGRGGYSFPIAHDIIVGENEGDYIEAPDFTVELDAPVTADILLELPSKHLCKEDCKGLCPKCGKNLNMGDCGCDLRETDPRLEILKSLLD